ncbi:hypothetical protein WJN01_12545 [Flavobacteriaceae bacterium SZ-1-7]|uniref:hypothetical protein n=1 Tax=Tamlana sedimenti TaxID=3134126 RepID=UPI00312AD1BA
MKTNFYILLAFLLTVSFASAQTNEKAVTAETTNTISVNNTEKVNVEVAPVKESDSLLISPAEMKEEMARANSDIRIYLNLKRKEGNIDILFPKMNKAVKA